MTEKITGGDNDNCNDGNDGNFDDDEENIAIVRNCPDVAILNPLLVFVFLSFCLFVFLSCFFVLVFLFFFFFFV